MKIQTQQPIRLDGGQIRIAVDGIDIRPRLRVDGFDISRPRKKENQMHYRNGREAKNGDKVVQLDGLGQVSGFGILHSAVAGNDYCNGGIALIPNTTACLIDCLHADDVAAMLKEKGLDKRPAGK